MSENDSSGVVQDERFGYWRLDPIPHDTELSEFYESQYYHLLRAGSRSPSMRRLAQRDEAAVQERAWLRRTLYEDLRISIEEHAPGRRVLDVGCGAGELVAALRDQGFEAEGIEPSREATAAACENGLPVEASTLSECADQHAQSGAPGFDALTMVNVLEHVPDPETTLRTACQLLVPGGLICVIVPNDFSELQRASQLALERDESWWVVRPDHINYFDMGSLSRLLEAVGVEIVERSGDFPMELFLLMGDDYIGDSDVGAECHRRRVSMELAMPSGMRRGLYRAFAEQGIGRNCVVIGRATG